MDRYDLAAQGAENGLWDWDLTTSRIHYSPGWISMLGWGGADFGNTSQEWFRRIHPEDLESVQREIKTQLAPGASPFERQHRMLHQDGCYRWMSCRGVITRDDTGRAIRISGLHSDITGQKVVDALTGLPNRLLLLDRLARSLEKAKKHEDFIFAVLMVDLDLFESGIDHLETINTDPLIIAAARRLETALKDAGVSIREGRAHLVARSAGEEFIILLDALRSLSEAKEIAENLLKQILAPFEFNGSEVFLSPSIGIALSATGYRAPEEALRDADTALYRAKAFGKSRCEVFDTAVLESTKARNQLEKDLQDALNRDEVVVHYQPIVSLSTHHIAGFEALVRWMHPSRGMIPPMDFIPLAEKSGLIVELDRKILRQACRQLKIWKGDPLISKDLWVSVNLSGTRFMQPSLAKEIHGILSEADLDASSLMLELTERAAMENPEAARSLMMQLRVMGARIGLDDFGTGYSSLAHLRRLPLDYLKIDYSFVRSIENGTDTLEIIRAVNILARQLGLRVIAEGIENSRQLEILRSLQCEYGQGFLFSRAVDCKQAEKLLREGFALIKQDPDQIAPAEAPTETGPPVEPLSGEPGKRRQALAKKRNYLLLGLAGLFALMMGILLVKMSPMLAFPPKKQAGADETAKPAPLPQIAEAVPASQIQAVPPATQSAELIPAVPKSVKKKPTGATARIYTLPVIHDHVLGSCRGTLSFTRSEISFNSERGKDSFACKPSECSYAIAGDKLIVRSGSRTFRFESATALNKDDNRSQISELYRNISNLYKAPVR